MSDEIERAFEARIDRGTVRGPDALLEAVRRAPASTTSTASPETPKSDPGSRRGGVVVPMALAAVGIAIAGLVGAFALSAPSDVSIQIAPASAPDGQEEAPVSGGDDFDKADNAGEAAGIARPDSTAAQSTGTSGPSGSGAHETDGTGPAGPCEIDDRVRGTLIEQPGPVFCRIEDGGNDTSEAHDNRWVDEFDHGLSFASFAGTDYRVFDGLGAAESIHWRHADHWMVDLTSRPKQRSAAMLSPDAEFTFYDGRLVIEADVAAGLDDYLAMHGAWPELIVTTGAEPAPSGRAGAAYGYEYFPNHYTLGCRLEPQGNTICSLMDDTDRDDVRGGRVWEMSFFQHVGDEVFGGARFGPGESAFRLCAEGDPDTECRDRFRLELTETSLTIFVNGILYFEQSGIPRLPTELVDGPVHVYFGSINAGLDAEVVRFHWDRVAVNPSTGPSAAPGFAADADTRGGVGIGTDPTPMPGGSPTPLATSEPGSGPTAVPTATVVPAPRPTATAVPTVTPQPTAAPEPTATAVATPTPVPNATPEPTPTPDDIRCRTDRRILGALDGAPAAAFCTSYGGGTDTAINTGATWLDNFDHGLSFATFHGTTYRVFEDLSDGSSLHWRHNDHWMVDITTQPRVRSGAMMSPNREFRFVDDTLVIEADVAAGMVDYDQLHGAWPEIVITPAVSPAPRGRTGAVYGYEYFPGEYTLGCRLEPSRNTICSLMDDTARDDVRGGRIWEMSFFQHVGDDVFGGGPWGAGADAFRVCQAVDPDIGCRDRFRLELTPTSLTISVNGVRYFAQTGIPELPAELTNGPIHVFFASMNSGLDGADLVRFHWDRLAVNPS